MVIICLYPAMLRLSEICLSIDLYHNGPTAHADDAQCIFQFSSLLSDDMSVHL